VLGHWRVVLPSLLDLQCCRFSPSDLFHFHYLCAGLALSLNYIGFGGVIQSFDIV
jgi:hypothetical protein